MSAFLTPGWLIVLYVATLLVLAGVPAADRWWDRHRQRRWAARQTATLNAEFHAITDRHEDDQ